MIKIMIVEDEINIALGIKKLIESMDDNLSITITGFSSEALKLLKIESFDLFLIDIELLDYSGIELAREIRDVTKYKMTPIVFITAIPTKELTAFKEIHCYDYIIKPFTKKEITDVIGDLLNFGIKKEEYITFQLKDFIYRLKEEDIIYLEAINRKIKVVTVNEEIQLSNYTLQNILTELNDNFIRCHKGYIINTKYIHNIDNTNKLIKLKYTDVLIPIGRKYREDLRSITNGYHKI